MRRRRLGIEWVVVGLCLVCVHASPVAADEPKQSADNTIALQLGEPVKPQTFSRPVKFYINEAIDRSGNPQPLLVFHLRGGVFLDREPTQIVRQALEDSLKGAAMLAPDRASADYLLTVYLFHFGLASSSGMDYFGKVDLNVVVKNPQTGKSQTVTALGTSVEKIALRKKNIQKNVKANLEEALQDAVRNFLRGTKLREAIETPGAAPSPTGEGKG